MQCSVIELCRGYKYFTSLHIIRSVFRFKTSSTPIPLFDFEYNTMEFSLLEIGW